jgi:hypothetical protein
LESFAFGIAAVLVLLAALLTVFTFRPNLVDQWVLPRTVAIVIQRFQSEILAAASGAYLDFSAFCVEHPAALSAECSEPLAHSLPSISV